ncbi:UNVERIFIED_CONTAM: POU domain, class 6, transcription factor 2 [Gekko kuhli]
MITFQIRQQKANLFPEKLQDPMIAGQVSKPLLSLRSEMNAELRGEDKAAASDNELNEPLLAPAESNDNEDTPSKLFEFMSDIVLGDLPLRSKN